jgi:hypothetical protein
MRPCLETEEPVGNHTLDTSGDYLEAPESKSRKSGKKRILFNSVKIKIQSQNSNLIIDTSKGQQ